jgi:glycosyltransferase involved in cell wall biosynthesis
MGNARDSAHRDNVMEKPPGFSYVLVTPARNEEEHIGKTILSVLSQTILPLRWVIVSDGSTDRTDEIVERYLGGNPWMKLVRMPEHPDRQFAAKVRCFNAGYEKFQGLEYDVVGSLDADISFDEEYFAFLLTRFSENPRLGVAGTPFVEGSSKTYNYNFANIEHVSGACQLFRRECFEEIGGYIPIEGGGIDWTAVTTARMKGWHTKTFTEKTCFHHRPIGTAGNSRLRARFNYGKKDYFLGGHPAWELFRALYQMKSRPFVIGGVTLLSGYLWAYLTGMERPIPGELIAFHQREQLERLKSIITSPFRPGPL